MILKTIPTATTQSSVLASILTLFPLSHFHDPVMLEPNNFFVMIMCKMNMIKIKITHGILVRKYMAVMII